MEENQIEPVYSKNTSVLNEVLDGISNYFSIYENHQIRRIFLFSSLTSMRLSYEDHKILIVEILNQHPNKVIYLPAFTYNSRRSVSYHKDEPPSPQNGSLSRVVFQEGLHKGARTLDEDYSYLILGNENRSEAEVSEESVWRSKSFGRNSHHEVLYSEPSVFFCVGNGMKDGFTPAMHFEALENVKYRKYIEIPSQYMEGRIKEYYAREEKLYQDFGKKGREKLVQEFKNSDKTGFRSYSLQGAPRLYAFTLAELSEVVSKALSTNKNFFLS